jgi:hypothetical protein
MYNDILFCVRTTWMPSGSNVATYGSNRHMAAAGKLEMKDAHLLHAADLCVNYFRSSTHCDALLCHSQVDTFPPLQVQSLANLECSSRLALVHQYQIINTGVHNHQYSTKRMHMSV